MEDQEDENEKADKTVKVYKIKYEVNMLPMVG